MSLQLPNFIYIGPPKSASTWIYQLLAAHPNIYVTPSKETYYFDRYYDRGLTWYQSHFRDAAERSVVAEVCHDYLFSELACERIARDLGLIKLMVCLREPVDRMFSGYLFSVRNGEFNGPFEDFIKSRPDHLARFRYADLLTPYIKTFGRDRILISMFDDLRSGPQHFATAIFHFLGVDSIELPAELTSRVNEAAIARVPAVSSLAKRFAMMLRDWGATRVIEQIKETPIIRRALYRKYSSSERPVPNPATVSELRAQLLDDVCRLDEMLGSQLAKRWNYS